MKEGLIVRPAELSDARSLRNIYAEYINTPVSFEYNLPSESEFAGKGYGDFKAAVAEAVVEEIRPVQQKFKQLIGDRAYLDACIDKGSQTATRISQRTLDKVTKKIGLL